MPRALARLLPTKTFANWDDALRECGSSYEDDVLAAVVVEKSLRRWADARATHHPSVAALLTVAGFEGQSGRFRVIDFGGTAGAHFFEIRELAPTLDLEWVIVETAAMRSAAQGLLPQEIRYAESIQEANKLISGVPHVLLAAGVLMYLPDPATALGDIIATKAQRLIFTQTGLSSSARLQTIVQRSWLSENGPGELPEGVQDWLLRYPNTFLPREVFEATILASYDIGSVNAPRAWRAGRSWIDQFTYPADRRADSPTNVTPPAPTAGAC